MPSVANFDAIIMCYVVGYDAVGAGDIIFHNVMFANISTGDMQEAIVLW